MDLRNVATAEDPEERNDAAGAPPQQTRSSVSSLLFLTFMMFLMTGGGSEDSSIASRNQYRDALESMKYQRSNYTAWLNGTESNFTLPPDDPTLFPLVHSFIPSPPLPTGLTSYYHNISGFLNGPSKLFNLTSLPNVPADAPKPDSESDSESTPWYPLANHFVTHADLNTTEAARRIGSYNWTGIDKVTISILELQREDLVEGLASPEELILMHGKLDFTNPNENQELHFQIDGVHFPANGSFVGFAAPKGRFSDLRELPSLVPAHIRNATAHAIEPELGRRITRLSNMIDSGSVEAETSADDANLPTCGFTFHFQLKLSAISSRSMQELESELDNPTGVSTVRAPPLALDAVLVSKECGILLEIREAKGIKVQRFWRKATTYAGYSFVVYLVLLVLLVRQVESETSRTPAGLSRVSRWSFVAQAGADAISFVGHLTFGIFSDNRSSLSLIAPGFLACLLLVYETQYAVLINQIQGPEDAALRENTVTPAPQQPADSATVLPAGTAPSPSGLSTGLIGVLRSRLTAEPQTRFWFIVVVSMIFFFNLIFSPILALFAVGMIYAFLWAPQIVRSARRGSRPALNKDYLIGSTLGRMFFALYIFGCPENVLGVDPSPYVWLIVGLVSFQVLVILCQDRFGPSFFLPKGWITVKVYDYHPSMPIPDAEAPKQSLGDCAICMEPIVVHPESPLSGSKGTSNPLLSATSVGIRRSYALAPCHHIFHTNCLEQWLAIKNICPQCRRPLPPL